MSKKNDNPCKIYVSNISRDTRERDLGRLFEECGKIGRLQFKNRFAFVEYDNKRDADDSVHRFDGMYFMGRRLRVETYHYRGGDRKYRNDNYSDDYRVYIASLDQMTSWQDLKDFGRTAGKSVTFADVRTVRNDDYNSTKKVLEGIIEYSDRRDYENALKELDGARLNGVRVKVYSKSSFDRSKFSDDNNRNNRDIRSRSRDRDRDRDSFRNNRDNRDNRDRKRRSRSYSRSNSRKISRSRSRERKEENKKIKEQSRSRSRSRSRTRSRSRSNHKKSQSRSVSRSPKKDSVSPN